MREGAGSSEEANMNETDAYWTGGQPPDGDRWSCADFGAVLDDAETRLALFRMYGRYVRRWNDIEPGIHQVHGAKVLAADGRFVLHGRPDSRSHWILEIVFARGFRVFHPCSMGRNAMRSTADMRSVHLHWSGSGRQAFGHWMSAEQAPRSRWPARWAGRWCART